MEPMWRVEMLGTLRAVSDDQTITRFRTRRAGLLLAYLAYYGERSHSRDELADMLWPESDPDFAHRNLRQALASLRRHLEPPSVPSGAVLVARQGRVLLNPKHVSTDVSEFQSLLQAAAETSGTGKLSKLKQAVELYHGDLLPGYYEDWVQRERLHLEDLLVSSLQTLVEVCEAKGEVDQAIRYVRLALAKDHLKEDLHATLMRLYLACERPASALQHFRDWTEQLARELQEEPGAEVRQLAEMAQRAGTGRPEIAKGAKTAPRREAPVERPEPERQEAIARLPVQLTRFFGRAEERDHAVRALAERRTRLVTLMGPAGTGKTRLSIEVGRHLAEAHGWNVWFVPLGDISDGASVPDMVAGAIRIRREAGSDPIDLLRANLSGDRNLLILDNLEHILERAAPSVESLLYQVGSASVLVTSRQSLKLGGEMEIDLATLPVPSEDLVTSQELAEVSSVQLFVDRAQAVVPDFQLTVNNARAIASICRKLDGLPLAVEIAAGLSGAFTPSQLLQNLANRLELLRSRRRDLSERHRSLRAAIDYSYELLSSELRRFFVSLSVFRGGFTLEGAGRVCLPDSQGKGNGKREQDDCLRMVLDLQERSLVRSEESGESCPARFRLLESFREYGAEYLSSDEELDLRCRHAEYYLSLGKGKPEVMAGERDNRLAALQFFYEQKRWHDCVVLLEALYGSTLVGEETLRALVRSEEFDEFDPVDQIMLLRLQANAHLFPSEFEESYRVSERALEIAQRIEREDLIAICYRGVGVAAGLLGRRDEAIALTERFIAYAEKAQDLRMMEHGYNANGAEFWAKGDIEAAMASFKAAFEVSTRLHGSEHPWAMLYNLARVGFDSGNVDDGMQFASEGLRMAQKHVDEYGISMCLALVSRYHRLRGNLVAAIATSREVLVRRRRVGYVYWTLVAIFGHAVVLAEMGRYGEATTLLAATRGISKQKRVMDDREFAASLEKVKASLSPSEFERAWAEGLAMSMDEAYRFAVNQA